MEDNGTQGVASLDPRGMNDDWPYLCRGPLDIALSCGPELQWLEL